MDSHTGVSGRDELNQAEHGGKEGNGQLSSGVPEPSGETGSVLP